MLFYFVEFVEIFFKIVIMYNIIYIRYAVYKMYVLCIKIFAKLNIC